MLCEYTILRSSGIMLCDIKTTYEGAALFFGWFVKIELEQKISCCNGDVFLIVFVCCAEGLMRLGIIDFLCPFAEKVWRWVLRRLGLIILAPVGIKN